MPGLENNNNKKNRNKKKGKKTLGSIGLIVNFLNETLILHLTDFPSLIEGKLSRVMRKHAFCICENKGVDQLHSKCAADQRLYFRYTDGTSFLIPKSEI